MPVPRRRLDRVDRLCDHARPPARRDRPAHHRGTIEPFSNTAYGTPPRYGSRPGAPGLAEVLPSLPYPSVGTLPDTPGFDADAPSERWRIVVVGWRGWSQRGWLWCGWWVGVGEVGWVGVMVSAVWVGEPVVAGCCLVEGPG
jgi:hypothetical protein